MGLLPYCVVIRVIRLPKLLLYYKPSGEICSHRDDANKGTCFDRLAPLSTGRWQSVGRLDTATSGLLLLTTSGSWVHFLTHPKYSMERTYWVKVDGQITLQHMLALKRGVQLSDGIATIDRYDRLNNTADSSSCEITVTEGRNRLIRRLFDAIDLPVKKLKRLRYGPFTLPAKLSPGQFVEADQDTLHWLDKVAHRHTKS